MFNVVCVLQGEIQVWLAEMMIMCRVWGGREKKGQPFITQFSLSTNKQRSKKHHLCLLCNDQVGIATELLCDSVISVCLTD